MIMIICKKQKEQNHEHCVYINIIFIASLIVFL
jgi:hypothetical protein